MTFLKMQRSGVVATSNFYTLLNHFEKFTQLLQWGAIDMRVPLKKIITEMFLMKVGNYAGSFGVNCKQGTFLVNGDCLLSSF